ncbi:uncharacterized protein LOC118478104 [Aplysia californica]|uniref:Uncharacterized protein LOC118478104 n=1 Tax=Aplysia californica TaxID=6500 RepID=A0ABM1VX01_APLCA|nr:uncharacterized protein LOC118478104 [Aplysia californica]
MAAQASADQEVEVKDEVLLTWVGEIKVLYRDVPPLMCSLTDDMKSMKVLEFVRFLRSHQHFTTVVGDLSEQDTALFLFCPGNGVEAMHRNSRLGNYSDSFTKANYVAISHKDLINERQADAITNINLKEQHAQS